MLTNRASVQAWDNACVLNPLPLTYQDPDSGALCPFRTRGLDANTALAFNKALRTYADLEGLTAVVSLYQVGANPSWAASETRNESTDPLAAPFTCSCISTVSLFPS